MAKDPYAILGVTRGASEKDVKSAYRKLAKELHPDHNKDNPKASERFSEVTQAYDLLSDKDKRARFDRGEIDFDGNPIGFGGGGFGGGGFGGGGQRGFGGGPEGVDLGDIFEGMFGGRGGGGFGRGAPPRGANVNYRLSVSLMEAAICAPQRITLSDGKTVDLKLPKGVEDGMQMRLAGKGEAGPGGAGDAMVTITILPHPFFKREGDNVLIDLPIGIDEAVAGAKVRVPTVEGAVMLTVAPLSSSGRTLRLKGKGFTRKDGTRGDQLIRLEITLPEAGSAAADDLAARLDGWSDPRDVRAKLA
ncbi:DnaJ domain-containing protein [Novosphingobium sp. FSY-8]|uniref:DnaJ domain-containing protein n=1 Tax=Novosphingobium ovatum TaxID=1908523 RepID=A0ABW9XHH5_9SPHN|nr:J domain-containing protein [Novosphingobium ovatum]NBC37928.1 DnaJ domain-containing protein [Novosphingobium ovatum]